MSLRRYHGQIDFEDAKRDEFAATFGPDAFEQFEAMTREDVELWAECDEHGAQTGRPCFIGPQWSPVPIVCIGRRRRAANARIVG